MQSFTEPQFNEMRKILEQEPEWLGGVVHGPQTRVSVAKLREIVPRRYPIRGYPDITHSMRCEYAVPDWDLAYPLTEGREVINPRPLDESAIFQLYRNNTRGVITYSEGCNDDVNKMIWSSLCWDPDAPSDRHSARLQSVLSLAINTPTILPKACLPLSGTGEARFERTKPSRQR